MKRLLAALIFCGFTTIAFGDGHKSTAVILVDMQTVFLKTTYVEPRTEIIASIKKMLEWAQAQDLPVIQFEYTGEGATVPELQAVLDHISRVKLIHKSQDNGFDGASGVAANEALHQWGIHTTIIAGINAGYCIKSTAEGALDNHYAVHTATPLVGAFNEDVPVYPDNSWWIPGTNDFEGFDTLEALFQTPLADAVNN